MSVCPPSTSIHALLIQHTLVQNQQRLSHLLLLVVQLLLLVDKVLLEAGQHLHGDVHLAGQFRGLVLQVLLLLAQSIALLLGPLQL